MKLVILVAHQRSGTNALRSTLLQSPYVEDFGESFNPEGWKYAPNLYHFSRMDDNFSLWRPSRGPDRFLSYYKYLSFIAEKQIGVIDAKYDMLRCFDNEVAELFAMPELFNLVEEVDGSFIHLTRNPFQIYVSQQVSAETLIFHVAAGDTSGSSQRVHDHIVDIDIADMVEYIGKRLFERRNVDAYVKSRRRNLTIDYSDLFSSGSGGISDEIWTFLGLRPHNLVPFIDKSLRRPYSQIISNYEAVASALQSAGWEDLL